MKKTLLIILSITCFSAHAQFWTSKATGFSQVNRGVDDISIVDDNVIWAKAYDGASNTPQNVRQFTRSTDSGNTWTSGTINLGTGQSTLNISSITAVSATTAWITAVPSPTGSGGVWKTADGGTTWTKQTTALFDTPDSYTNFVYFWDENNGITQGDPSGGYFEIYTTTDGGTTWTRVPSTNITAPLAGEYGYAVNYDVVGNTIWFGTNKGRLYKSTNQGLNWTATQSPITDFGGTVRGSYSFSDINKGLLYGSNGTLYSTSNGGTTWTAKTFTGNIGNRNIEYIPGTDAVVSVGTTPNSSTSYTAYSTDNGSTWTEVMSGTQVTTLKFKDASLGFGGGFTINSTTGGIFKYSETVLSTDHFTSNKNLMVYPNPTTGLITVSGKNLNEIKIFDMTGKVVMARKVSLSDNLNLDVSALSSGIYLLNAVDNSGSTSTLKFSKQ
ncbi:T9SS type A sorting domain-containing protein [Flavobacterium sp. PLA-1-15]|uniref:T9SS type A sorting domain-containing protein n=1 Tax=Flavobacterium sp. PLA-1-15 TaxID=3380533 RepID=UPI003B795E7E